MNEEQDKTTSPYDFGKTNSDIKGVFSDSAKGISGNFKDAGKEVGDVFKGVTEQVNKIFAQAKEEEKPTAEQKQQWEINAQSTKDPQEVLADRISDLQAKLDRIVDAHDSDTTNTEQGTKIQRLIDQVDILEKKVRTGYQDFDPNPVPFIWLGEDDTTNVIERVCNTGTFAPMTQGRTVASSDIYTLADGQAFFYDFLDFNGGTQVMRRVKISGGGGGTGMIIARIDSDRTKGECYKGYIQTLAHDEFTVGSGSSFSAADIGTDGDEISLLNFQEGDSVTTHTLTAASQILLLVIAFPLGRLDENGKQCYAIVAKDFKTC